MARFKERSNRFTYYWHVYPRMEWAILPQLYSFTIMMMVGGGDGLPASYAWIFANFSEGKDLSTVVEALA